MWHPTVPVKSRKVQLGVKHSSKQSGSDKGFERKPSIVESVCVENKSMLENTLEGNNACSGRYFEGSVASEHARAVISRSEWPLSTLQQ